MQVENIECQIAKAQIGNYLAGAGLSDEALSQLEEHLGACADCKKTLDDRRNELLTLLAEEPKSTADSFEEPTGSATSIAGALRKKSLQALTSRAAVAAVPTPKVEAPVAQAAVEAPEATENVKAATFWKPLLYSLALGAVLVGMSLFSKNASGILGTKLADSPPTETSSAAAPVVVTSAPKGDVVKRAEPITVAQTEPKATSPATTPDTTPTKVVTPTPTSANAQTLKSVATPPAKITPPAKATPPAKTTPAASTPAKPISTAPKQPANQAAPRPQAATTTKATGPGPIVHTTVARRWAPRRYRPIRRAPIHRGVRKVHHTGIKIYDPSGKPL